MNKYFYTLCLTLLISVSALAQQAISGKIKDQNGKAIQCALVSLVNRPSEKTITDKNGIFALDAKEGDCVEISLSNTFTKKVWLSAKANEIVMLDKDRVVSKNIATGSNFRSTQATSTVNSEDLSKNSAVNPYNALYGLLPGLTQIQNTGLDANPSLNIRGRGTFSGSVLVIVDGFPRAIENVNLTDVESVTVLKDGAAALYGVRGANGVILVTTKRGSYNKPMDIAVKYTYGLGLPTNMPTMANSYNYAKAVNEALYYDGLSSNMFGRYSQTDLDFFKNGNGDADLYPNTDWVGEAINSYAPNNQFDISFTGGGKKVRYYSSIFYKNDQGVINDKYSNYSSRYNSQIRNFNLGIRMNLDVDVTNSTLLKVNTNALLRENSTPDNTVSTLFTNLYKTPSAAFPVKTVSGKWGGNSIIGLNPLAEFADEGFYKTNGRLLQTDMRLIQDLSDWAQGLKAEIAISFDNFALYQEKGSKTYQYEINTAVLNSGTGNYDKNSNLNGLDGALSIDNTGISEQYMNSNIEANMAYDRSFGLHNVNATALYRQESNVPLGQNNTRLRQYFVGMVGYNFANKYMVDALVNYSGSSVLPEGDRYRTYPSLSAAWVASNEDFLKESSVLTYLKMRASYGRSGYDNISYEQDKQFWVGGTSYNFQSGNTSFGGTKEGTLANTNLSIESSDKYNVGFDAELFKNLTVTADAFYDKRRSILVDGSPLISSAIGIDVAQQNIGAIDTKGIEIAATWKQSTKDFNYYIGGNLMLAHSNVIENGEGFQPFDNMYKTGYSIGQVFGLEHIGYFADQADIDASPKQLFSEVRPGDLKYADVNDDGKINEYDVKAIGNSSAMPGLYFGINLGFEYKGFGVDAVFQGVGQFSRVLNTANIYWPLRNNSNISDWYLNDMTRWTETTKETANLPRLTTLDNANNFRTSTQWLVDASYLKLRNLNVHYNLPEKLTKNLKLEKVKLYVSANNLLSLDNVKNLNCEDLSMDYPDMQSVYFGVNINF